MKDKHEKEQLTDLAFERFKGLAFERIGTNCRRR